MWRGFATKVGESHAHYLGVLLAILNHRELELHVGVSAGFLGFQVPLAFVGAPGFAPAETD
ncbi:hypothetical protein D3C87_1927580 [compost metagenome]